mgnify:CR=1 FL=1
MKKIKNQETHSDERNAMQKVWDFMGCITIRTTICTLVFPNG